MQGLDYNVGHIKAIFSEYLLTVDSTPWPSSSHFTSW
jgi:hypothetical protein